MEKIKLLFSYDLEKEDVDYDMQMLADTIVSNHIKPPSINTITTDYKILKNINGSGLFESNNFKNIEIILNLWLEESFIKWIKYYKEQYPEEPYKEYSRNDMSYALY